jgi:ketosteroid isomerase-like protein
VAEWFGMVIKSLNTPQEFISAYENALATQTWEEVAPLIHENCVATFSEGTYIGKAEVAAAFRKTFSLIKNEKYSISNVRWILETAETAILIYNFSWSGLIEGKPAAGSGRGTSVLIRQNGRWQLICEHLGPPVR